MRLLFTLAEEKDAEEILKNVKSIFKNDLEKYRPESLPMLAHLSTERLINAFVNHVYYKIVLDHQIIGGIHLIPKEEGHFYLNQLYVLAKFQGLGIGKRAISFIEENHSQIVLWTLDVAFDNFKNHKFYGEVGYKKTGENIVSDYLTVFEYRKDISLNK